MAIDERYPRVDRRVSIHIDIWEPTHAGEHRRVSRRPEVITALDRLVHSDPHIAGPVTDLVVDEQRWGATALHYAGSWRETRTPVLLKLGVTEHELHWARALATHVPELAPILFASGERLGSPPGLTLGWTVTERISFGLNPAWRGYEFDMLLDAGVRFQREARQLPPGPARIVDGDTVRAWLERGLRHDPPGLAQRLLDRVDEDWAWVAAVCPPETCHGDLHMANVLCRTPPPAPGRALLIDPAPAIQPWSFDAAWAQALNSIDRRRAGYTGLIPRMAAIRETYGLETCHGSDLDRLATITLGWFAIVVWTLTPDRRSIPDYALETRRYIEESAAI